MSELEVLDWRRRVAELYAMVRAETRPEAAHTLWRTGRDKLFLDHPESPLAPTDPLRSTGLRYWPYDAALRFELAVVPTPVPAQLSLPTGEDGITRLRRIASVELPPPFGSAVELWWLEQYGGGVFLPLRDGTAGDTSYAGGRYLLDSAKGADLGGDPSGATLTVDLNFLYHPSCRYSARWQCPLAPAGNIITAAVRAGERL